MPDELVFSVQASRAVAALPITLAEAGLTERAHLQEWVMAHPAIIGEGVLVITSEFDLFESPAGPERDRLDILGLDRSGRLVLAELKRDLATDTVEMQAIKYAARVSRFTPEVLVSHHAEFLRRRGAALSDQEAMALLVEHVGGELDADLFRQPRIVLIASAFPYRVTSTVVWLNEMGLDMTLVRVQAYRTEQEIVITASQLYPTPTVEDFTIAPVRASTRRQPAGDYPVIPWNHDDLVLFAGVVTNRTVLAAMELCSTRPDEWISLRDIEAAAGSTFGEARAGLAGLSALAKRQFGRSNKPFTDSWAAGGDPNMYYRMESSLAEDWRSIVDAPL